MDFTVSNGETYSSAIVQRHLEGGTWQNRTATTLFTILSIVFCHSSESESAFVAAAIAAAPATLEAPFNLIPLSKGNNEVGGGVVTTSSNISTSFVNSWTLSRGIFFVRLPWRKEVLLRDPDRFRLKPWPVDGVGEETVLSAFCILFFLTGGSLMVVIPLFPFCVMGGIGIWLK